MRFFKGAITYRDFMEMSIPEIYNWVDRANDIIREENRDVERMNSRARRR